MNLDFSDIFLEIKKQVKSAKQVQYKSTGLQKVSYHNMRLNNISFLCLTRQFSAILAPIFV